MLTQRASLARVDFRPRYGQPPMSRLILATLAADALLVVIGQAVTYNLLVHLAPPRSVRPGQESDRSLSDVHLP
jgi:hypothetical protein